MQQQTLFSGAQPTSGLHIGNYLGALRNWVALQYDYHALYTVVDLHALTSSATPQELTHNSRELVRNLLAIGIDPDTASIFIQSHIPEHAELAWIFNTLTPMAELERMTQYKDKSQRQSQNINVGLFDYPVLQAADILLYHGEIVPVGEDQLQHVELTRIIARKFNNKYGNYFPEPEAKITTAKRIMSLTDPAVKMSKSHGESNYIALNDTPDVIRKKIAKAVTDTGERTDTMSHGVENLFNLLTYTDATDAYESLHAAYQSGTLKYSELKAAVADSIIALLEPIQQRRQEISDDDITRALTQGYEHAQTLAQQTMQDVRQLVGFVPK